MFFISVTKRRLKVEAGGGLNKVYKVYQRTVLTTAQQYQNVWKNFLQTTQSAQPKFQVFVCVLIPISSPWRGGFLIISLDAHLPSRMRKRSVHGVTPHKDLVFLLMRSPQRHPQCCREEATRTNAEMRRRLFIFIFKISFKNLQRKWSVLSQWFEW